MKHMRWKNISSKTVLKNRWFKVRQDKVLTPEGKMGEYNVVMKPPAVFVVAVNDARAVAPITLFRYTTQTVSIEIPAGGTEHQPPLRAAKRELQEETGFVAKRWSKIGTVQIANGILDQVGHVYMARGLSGGHGHRQQEEGIEKVQFVPMRRALRMIERGEITDANTIYPLLMAALRLRVISR